ncbi:hypothetical protein PULV_a3485 [Pseudoalteromonas ulvae UL12]|uniref:EAL domain-containing protein n=1 Tax=Pseudoalteromonas ulvae TaxID=107327 RepID=UPI00186B890A|nr:EAL domain-containing protein [Pseudoalteromonas ulvae]MBE0363302.1 hypothetical protein [Pseudoalteromonas ulvae UL12]
MFYTHVCAAIEITGSQGSLINYDVEALYDPRNELTIDSVLLSVDSLAFQVHESIALVLPERTLWLKIKLTNRLNTPQPFVLHLDNPTLDYIDFYLVENGAVAQTRFIGSRRSIEPKLLNVFPHFKGQIASNASATVFIKVLSNGLPHTPIFLHTPDEFEHLINFEFAFWGAFVGILALMFLYNISLFFNTSNTSFLYYNGFIISGLMTTALSHGFIHYLLPSLLVEMVIGHDVLFKLLMATFAIQFALRFLNVKKTNKRIYKLGLQYCGLCLISVLLSFFIDETLLNYVVFVYQVLFYLVMSAILFPHLRSTERWIRTYLLSWLPIYITAIVVPLSYFGVLSYSHLVISSFMVGLIVQVTLVTIAHAERYRAKEEKQKYLTTHDPICGLPNHVVLSRALSQLHNLSKAHTLVFFKPDTYADTRANFGILHANEYITELSFQLNTRLDGLSMLVFEQRELGIPVYICRFNDDTFAVVINSDVTSELIEQYVSNIKGSLEQGVYLDGTYLVGQVDIGIARYPEHAESVELLIQRALQSLQLAANEADHWHLYRNDTDNIMKKRLKLAADLHQAIENNEFYLYHQPQIDLRTNSIYGSEALLRWDHPELGFVSPEEFIPVAESAGIINEITEWVVEQALLHQKNILTMFPNHKISINISARDLNKRELPVQLLTLLTELNIKPSLVVIELTESATVGDSVKAKNILDDFKEMGIKVAIDDYGTGYSSLAYLSQLGFHEIKIDKQFVMNLEHNKRDQTICKTTIEMASNLDAYVVAEGVESEQIAKILRQFGCEIAQGYHYSKPLPFVDYCQWLQRYKKSA